MEKIQMKYFHTCMQKRFKCKISIVINVVQTVADQLRYKRHISSFFLRGKGVGGWGELISRS